MWVSPIKKKIYLVTEKQETAVRVPIQKLGEVPQPTSYFSRQLDFQAWCGSGCFWAVAATASLVEEANKLSFGQSLDVQTPHQVQGILETKGHHWLTGAHLTKYQALLHLPRGNLNTLNLATPMLLKFQNKHVPALNPLTKFIPRGLIQQTRP